MEEVKQDLKTNTEFTIINVFDGSQGNSLNSSKAPGAKHFYDEWEEGIVYESLTLNSLKIGINYRLRIKNRDPSEHAEANLKIVISEYDL